MVHQDEIRTDTITRYYSSADEHLTSAKGCKVRRGVGMDDGAVDPLCGICRVKIVEWVPEDGPEHCIRPGFVCRDCERKGGLRQLLWAGMYRGEARCPGCCSKNVTITRTAGPEPDMLDMSNLIHDTGLTICPWCAVDLHEDISEEYHSSDCQAAEMFDWPRKEVT